jgi:hypothetical protein
LIYDDLRQMARRMLGRERPDHSLQPTALVHEWKPTGGSPGCGSGAGWEGSPHERRPRSADL